MKKLIVTLFSAGILLFANMSFAESEFTLVNFEQVPIDNCGNSSSPAGKGGVGTLPWSAVRSFPWTSIQGLWMASADNSPTLYFSFRVTRATNKYKQLAVEVYQAGRCGKPLMRGVGVQSSSDKNIVRVNMNSYLLKLGSFNSSDLDLNPAQCGYRTLGANFQKLANDNESSKVKAIPTDLVKAQNVLLKKISSSTTFKCKNN